MWNEKSNIRVNWIFGGRQWIDRGQVESQGIQRQGSLMSPHHPILLLLFLRTFYFCFFYGHFTSVFLPPFDFCFFTAILLLFFTAILLLFFYGHFTSVFLRPFNFCFFTAILLLLFLRPFYFSFSGYFTGFFPQKYSSPTLQNNQRFFPLSNISYLFENDPSMKLGPLPPCKYGWSWQH